MTDETVSPETQAFLLDIADKMESAASKLESQNGAAFHPATTSSSSYLNADFGRKLAYTTCYMISYGVCLPVFAACRYVPKNNHFVDGLTQGSEAANEAVDNVFKSAREWRNSRQEKLQESMQQGLVADAGAEALAPG